MLLKKSLLYVILITLNNLKEGYIMKLRFKEGQKVLVRCAPGIFNEGIVDSYIDNIDIYEMYRITYYEDGKKYVGQFYDIHMMPLSF